MKLMPLGANKQETRLWLGTWQGTVEDDTTAWLRFYDTFENLVLLPEEAERQRAERLAARLRELGEDLNSI